MPIQPSALNVLIIGLSSVLFTFVWRQIANRLAENDSPIGAAMGAAL